MELSMLGNSGSGVAIIGVIAIVVVMVVSIFGTANSAKGDSAVYDLKTMLFTVLVLSVISFIAMAISSYAMGSGDADDSLPEGTFLVQSASSGPDGYLHVVIEGKQQGVKRSGEASPTLTKYVMLRQTEVKNFPAEPVQGRTFKLVVSDQKGTGQKWRIYTFVSLEQPPAPPALK